jgi:hypothetical protein|tara:strand:- start:167 stop:442 length:276 start_codon:yes stop_codon:yes gene_type:complete
MADLQKFSVKESLNQMVYDKALAITASDGADVSGAPYKALYVGVGGDVKLDLNGSGSAIVFKNLASGQLLPLVFDRVYSTGTTATNLVALK